MNFSTLLLSLYFILPYNLKVYTPVEEYTRFVKNLADKTQIDFSNKEVTSRFIKYLMNFPFIEYVEIWGDDKNVKVLCNIKYLFKGLKIKGLKGWEKNWIRDSLPYKEGSYYTKEELKEIEKDTIELLERDGYIIKKHSFKVKIKGKESTVYIKIIEGKRRKVKVLHLKAPEKAKKYTKRFKKWKGKGFSFFKFKELIEKTRAKFIKMGYYEVSIIWDTQIKGEELYLDININPGKKYTFEVKGKTSHFSKKDFERVAKKIYQDEGYISEELLLKEVQKLLSKAGFGESIVRINRIETENFVTFLAEITEKESIYVKKIRFEGVETFSEETLKKQIVSSEYRWYKRIFDENNGIFLPEFVKEDTKRIERFYRINSFLDAVCKLDRTIKEKDGYVIVYKVKEGKRYVVKELTIKPFVKKFSHNSLKLPVGYYDVEMWLSKYRDFLNRSGYRNLHFRIFTEKIDEDDKNIYIKITVDQEGDFTPYKTGYFFFYGNKRLSDSIATGMIKDLKNKAFNSDTRLEIYTRLSSLEYFKGISFLEIDNPLLTGTADLGISLEEVKVFRIFGGVGYATEEGARTFLSLSFPDLGGKAIDLIFYGKGAAWVDSLQPRSLFRISNYELSVLQGKIELVKKYFFSPFWRLGSIMNYHYLNRPNYEISFLEFSLFAQGNISHNLTLITGYSFRMREPKSIPPEFSPESQFFSIGFLTAEIIYDKRNHPVLPSSGFIVDLKTDVALKTIFSESNYLKSLLRTKLYFPAGRFIFSTFFRAGYAHVFTKGLDLPIEEKFFLGGANTIRGFKEDSVGPPLLQPSSYYSTTGGNFMLNYGIEAQFSITRKFYIGIFFDGGGVFRNPKDFDTHDLREGAGFGIKWKTPIGEISADMGFKLDRREGEKLNVFHFSVGRFI